MAIIGTATAGFARALPEPAQQRFEAVVEVVTGHEFPDRPGRDGSGLAPVRPPADEDRPSGADDRPGGADDRPGGAGGPGATDRGPGGSARTGGGPVTGDGPDAGGPAEGEADPDGSRDSEPTGDESGEAAGSPDASPTGLGGEVREGARDGSVHGGEVSEWARGRSSGADDSSIDDSGLDGGSIEDSGLDGGADDGGADGGGTNGGSTDGGGTNDVAAAGRVEPYGLGAGGSPMSRTPGERPSGREPPTALALARERPPQPAVGARAAAGGVVTGEPVSGADAGA